MADNSTHLDRRFWAIGGGTLVGLGVGFLFLTTNIFAFIASMFIGMGGGLLLASLLPKR